MQRQGQPGQDTRLSDSHSNSNGNSSNNVHISNSNSSNITSSNNSNSNIFCSYNTLRCQMHFQFISSWPQTHSTHAVASASVVVVAFTVAVATWGNFKALLSLRIFHLLPHFEGGNCILVAYLLKFTAISCHVIVAAHT